MNHPNPYAFGRQTVETAQLQRALSQPPGRFYTGPLDGIFGRDTKAAVEAAQRHFSLVATGTPDRALLAFLGLASAKPRASNPISDYVTGLVVKAALNHLKGLPIMDFLTGYKTYIIGGILIICGGVELLGIVIPGMTGDPGTLIMTGIGMITGRMGAKADVKKAVGL